MSQPQVEQAIGSRRWSAPCVSRTMTTITWCGQYQMVPPPGAWCPTEAASRVITGGHSGSLRDRLA